MAGAGFRITISSGGGEVRHMSESRHSSFAQHSLSAQSIRPSRVGSRRRAEGSEQSVKRKNLKDKMRKVNDNK